MLHRNNYSKVQSWAARAAAQHTVGRVWAERWDKAFYSSVARVFRRHQREGESQHLEGAGQAGRGGGGGYQGVTRGCSGRGLREGASAAGG